MKQPDDTKTAELDLAAKRGRGRPALEHALTPAERAKRYRDAKRAAGASPTKQHTQIKNHQGNPIPEITSKTYYDTLTAYHTARKEIDSLAKALLHKTDEANALRTQADLKASARQTQKHQDEIEKLTDDLKFANAEIKSIQATAKAESKKARDNMKKAAEREDELKKANSILHLELNKLRDASQK